MRINTASYIASYTKKARKIIATLSEERNLGIRKRTFDSRESAPSRDL